MHKIIVKRAEIRPIEGINAIRSVMERKERRKPDHFFLRDA